MSKQLKRSSSIACEPVEPRWHLTAATVNGGSSADEIRMTVTPSTILVDVNGFTSSYSLAVINSVSIQSGGGADRIYIDSNDGVPVTINAGGGDDEVHLGEATHNLDQVPTGVTLLASAGTDVLFLHDDASAWGDTYTVDNGRVSRGGFGGVAHGGVNSIRLASGEGVDTFNVRQTNGANLILDAQAGEDLLNLGSTTGGIAAVTFETDQSFAKITTEPGGTLNLAGSAGLLLSANQSNFDGNVTLGTGFIIERDSEAVGGLGYWRERLGNGTTGATPSLVSPFAASSTVGDAIGYAYAQDLPFTSVGGLAIDEGDLVLRYTLKGDANLDRTVNFADLVALAQNYNVATQRDWRQGDFDLSRGVNFADLVALAQNYNQSAAVATPALLKSKTSASRRVASSVIA